MSRLLWALILAALTLPTALAATPAQTFLSLDSQPGDYVGQGMIQTFTPVDGTFSVQGTTSYISVFFMTPTYQFWTLNFRAPSGQKFVSGVYEAERSSSSAATMDIGGGGRGCNQSVGRFLIADLAFRRR